MSTSIAGFMPPVDEAEEKTPAVQQAEQTPQTTLPASSTPGVYNQLSLGDVFDLDEEKMVELGAKMFPGIEDALLQGVVELLDQIRNLKIPLESNVAGLPPEAFILLVRMSQK